MTSRQNKRVPTSNQADQCFTPAYALDPVLPYLDSRWLIWESACGLGHLSDALRRLKYQVIDSDITAGLDFFVYSPPRFDCQLTNPPYSLKLTWLKHSYELNRPFALLLPVEILGVGQAQILFEKYGVEVILLNRRVDFKTSRTAFSKSSCWFPSCWITWGLGIGQQLTFGKITKRPNEQMTLTKL